MGSINGWEDINQIQVSTNSWQYEAVRWRNEVETESSIQVRFYQEIEIDGGNWYHNKFLGSMEKRDGFIEIRDENWNTVSRVIDPDSASGFADVLAQNPELDWAWDQVMPYLPDEAQDRDALSFTQDEYQIYAFDDQGNMVVQINIWSWTDSFMTNGDTVLREETSYDYNFQDADWNNFGSARKSQELITDLTAPDDPTDPLYDASKIEALDRANTGTSFVVRKDDEF